MDNNDLTFKNKQVFTGIFLLGLGTLLLTKNFGLYFPNWLISWPMLLIGLGIYKGIKHDFRKPSWLILVAVGSVFLVERIFPHLLVHRLIWPMLLIGIGMYFIVFPKQNGGSFENN